MVKLNFDEVRTVSDEKLKRILERRLSFWMKKLNKAKIIRLKDRIYELNKKSENKNFGNFLADILADIIGVSR